MTQFYCELNANVVGPLSGVDLREAALASLVLPQTQIATSAAGPWTAATNASGLFSAWGTPLPHPPETLVPQFHVRTGDGAAGPFLLHQLIQYAQQGKLAANTSIRTRADGEWFPAGTLKLLEFGQRSTARSAASPPARHPATSFAASADQTAVLRRSRSPDTPTLDDPLDNGNIVARANGGNGREQRVAVATAAVHRGNRYDIARPMHPAARSMARLTRPSSLPTNQFALNADAATTLNEALLQFLGRTSLLGIQLGLSLGAIGCLLLLLGSLFGFVVMTDPHAQRLPRWDSYGRPQAVDQHAMRDFGIRMLFVVGGVSVVIALIATLTSCLLTTAVPDDVESKGFLFAGIVCLGCLVWTPPVTLAAAPLVVSRDVKDAVVILVFAMAVVVAGALVSLSLFLSGLGRHLRIREIPTLAWISVGIDIVYFAWLSCLLFLLKPQSIEWILLDQIVTFAGIIVVCSFLAYIIHRIRKHLVMASSSTPPRRRGRARTASTSTMHLIGETP